MPESPVWLRSKKRYKEAEQSMAWLKLTPTPQMVEKIESTSTPTINANSSSQMTFSSYFTRPILMPLSIGLTLLVLQQISGIDAIIFFTVEIFRAAGK